MQTAQASHWALFFHFELMIPNRTHLQSQSCLRCSVSSCCSSSCTAAAAASPSWSTRRAARSTRQSAPAPLLPRCPPRAPAQTSRWEWSSCLDCNGDNCSRWFGRYVETDGEQIWFDCDAKKYCAVRWGYLCFPPLLSHVVFRLEPRPLKLHFILGSSSVRVGGVTTVFLYLSFDTSAH